MQGVTLFTSTEIGLAASVGFSIVYTLLRLAFPRTVIETTNEDSNMYPAAAKARVTSANLDIPSDSFLVKFSEDLLFPNAARIKNKIVDTIKLHYEPSSEATTDVKKADRNWNAVGNNKIGRIRRRKGIIPMRPDISPLRHVVLDFTVRLSSTALFCLS